MKRFLLVAILLLAGATGFPQTTMKCYTAVLDDTRLSIYLDKDNTAGKLITVKHETDTTVWEFTCTVKGNYVYPVFSTDDLHIIKGTSITKDPFKLVMLAEVHTLRITVANTKRSATTTSTLILAACDE